jgi:hypothetical protein
MVNNPASVLPPADDNEALRRAANSPAEHWVKVTALVGGAVSYIRLHSADLCECTRRQPNGGSATHTRGTEF